MFFLATPQKQLNTSLGRVPGKVEFGRFLGVGARAEGFSSWILGLQVVQDYKQLRSCSIWWLPYGCFPKLEVPSGRGGGGGVRIMRIIVFWWP